MPSATMFSSTLVRNLCEKGGVECLEDLMHFDKSDYIDRCGFTTVQANRAMNAPKTIA